MMVARVLDGKDWMDKSDDDTTDESEGTLAEVASTEKS